MTTGKVLLLIAQVLLASALDKRLLHHVTDITEIGQVASDEIVEASGLCASRRHPDIIYTINDSGHKNEIYALNATTAQLVATLTVTEATNVDWEDLACGKCFGHLDDFCIYIGNVGSANGNGSANRICRVEEPATLTAQVATHVEGDIHFSWTEPNSGTIMLTPDAELYIISKVHGGKGHIASVPSSGWDAGSPTPLKSTHQLSITSSHSDPDGGDISPDGQEILIKCQDEILHYSMNGMTDYEVVLTGTPVVLPYIHEKQGESIAFSADGQSYYTIGEGPHPTLYKYAARKRESMFG